MKLGVHIGYWGLGLTSSDQLQIVQEAERLGYDSVWAAEAYGSDTATVLAWLAGQTSTIRLASGIFQIPARSAAMTAMTAATIDQLSDGRMILGIGTSGPQVSEGWHGVRFGKQEIMVGQRQLHGIEAENVGHQQIVLLLLPIEYILPGWRIQPVFETLN